MTSTISPMRCKLDDEAGEELIFVVRFYSENNKRSLRRKSLNPTRFEVMETISIGRH